MGSAELLQAALRVLDAVAVHHATPAPEAVNLLRQAAPDHASDPLDELATLVISREVERLNAEQGQSQAAGA